MTPGASRSWRRPSSHPIRISRHQSTTLVCRREFLCTSASTRLTYSIQFLITGYVAKRCLYILGFLLTVPRDFEQIHQLRPSLPGPCIQIRCKARLLSCIIMANRHCTDPHPVDFGLPFHLDSIHACKSSSWSHRCDPIALGWFLCRNHPRANAWQRSA